MQLSGTHNSRSSWSLCFEAMSAAIGQSYFYKNVSLTIVAALQSLVVPRHECVHMHWMGT